MFPTTTQNDLPTFDKGFKPPADVDVKAIADEFLAKVEAITAANDGQAFANLFLPIGHWKDTLAFTRDMRDFKADNIALAANETFPITQAKNFKIPPAYQPKLEPPFPDVQVPIIHLDSETSLGPCRHIARLAYDNHDQQWKVWSYFTKLEGLNGFTCAMDLNRPTGKHNDSLTYASRRSQESQFENADPDVLIVGAGHNGLAAAAYLQSYGLTALCIGREERIGDNWRKRYDALSLHDPIFMNHLPFLPFPSTWPTFPSAGKLANWLEVYTEALELNVWVSTTLDPTKSHFANGKWHVTVLRTTASGTTSRDMTVSHIILSTGLSGGFPKLPPPVEGQASWTDKIAHSTQVHSGKEYTGKKVLVVGSASSANDLAMDIANHGGKPTMLQRSPTFVMSVENGVLRGVQRLATGQMSIEELDYNTYSVPLPLAKPCFQRLTKYLEFMDRNLLTGLKNAGYQTWGGIEGTGYYFLGIARAGGVYYDTGACQLIIDGRIKVKQGEIASFKEDKIEFKDGSEEEFDAVVYATGFTGYTDSVASLLGPEYAKMLTPIGGFAEDGEIAGIARTCGIPNVYFNIGALMNARWFAKVIALQVIAEREGLLGSRYSIERQKQRESEVEGGENKGVEGKGVEGKGVEGKSEESKVGEDKIEKDSGEDNGTSV